MRKARFLLLVLRYFGVGWVFYRLARELGRLLRIHQFRCPVRQWDDFPLSAIVSNPNLHEDDSLHRYRLDDPVAFLFSSGDLPLFSNRLKQFDGDGPGWAESRLDELQRGYYRFFCGAPREIGMPPNWKDNLLEGLSGPPDTHFSRVDLWSSGDVKCVWDLNRLSFVFDLVRGFGRTADDRWVSLFWDLFEDWCEHNAPNEGVNWASGQECAFRAFAVAFGYEAFRNHPQTTSERTAMVVRFMAVTARRIRADIRYALSQKNNHGVSEAAGLFVIGLLFPELKESDDWVAHGKRLLEEQLSELIYEDGAFSQNSINYHRLMLQVALFAVRIGELNGEALSSASLEKLRTAGRFVERIQDRVSGRVPLYGLDDGSLLFPLTNCDYQDYRPVVQTFAAYFEHRLPFGDGPWDEEAFWLLGPERLDGVSKSIADSDFSAAQGGCHVLRADQGVAMMRCGTFRHRPADLDLLHVDLWWRGTNVAIDPGTYAYNAHGPWGWSPFRRTWCHNTLKIDDREQAEVFRFLVLPWPGSELTAWRRSAGNGLAVAEMRQLSYAKTIPGVGHHRAVVGAGPEHWIVVDRVTAADEHSFALHWLLPDAPVERPATEGTVRLNLGGVGYEVKVSTIGLDSEEVSLVRADPESPRGWRAIRYMLVEPAISLLTKATGNSGYFVSLFGPAPTSFAANTDVIELTAGGEEMRLQLNRADPRLPVFKELSLIRSGTVVDHLQI